MLAADHQADAVSCGVCEQGGNGRLGDRVGMDFFGETITAGKIIGAVVIICGILLVVTEKEESHG